MMQRCECWLSCVVVGKKPITSKLVENLMNNSGRDVKSRNATTNKTGKLKLLFFIIV
jgi:hypothetical protein